MAFLTLSGILVPVAMDSGTLRAANLGEYARSYSGRPYSTVRARPVDMLCRTTPMALSTANAFRNLLEGHGHVWSFDTSEYSSRGLAPLAAVGSFTVADNDGKYGLGLLLDGVFEDPSYLTWNVVHNSAPSTVCYWRLEGATWHHYALVTPSSGGSPTVYKDGVAGASNPGVVTLVGGVLKAQASGVVEQIDDLLALPYAMPADWPAQLAASATPFGSLPKHTAGGEWLEGLTDTVLAQWRETVPVPNFAGPGTVGGALDFEIYGDPRSA